MVDDGDNVICVRVLEKPLKAQKGEKEKECWQREARKVMQGVIERVSAGGKGPAGAGREKAIAVTVELAVGKREGCFQKMVRLIPLHFLPYSFDLG